MKHNAKKTLALLLALVMVLSLVPAMGIAAYADDTSYTLTIPSALTVANSGWNATDGISATGTLASGKKLTVTAASDGEFALVKQDENTQKVGYKLAESGDTNTTIDNATEKTAWEFTALGGAAQGLGIVVEDYSSKPAGTYQDTVTFTAKVEDAAPATITVTINQSDWGDGYSGSFTKDGVTVSAEIIDSQDGNLMGGGTFSTTLGNFTKIVVTTFRCYASGTGWSGSGSSMTWAGTPASTVSFSGEFMGRGRTQTTIVCTIEPTN